MSRMDKIASSFAWNFSYQIVQALVNLVVSIVLARLMLPSEFGLIGMIAVFVAVGEALINGGLTASLTRAENPDQADYSTVFFINLGVGILLYILVFATAPLVADFFHQKILTPILRVYMTCTIVFAFSAVQCTKLYRELNFKFITVCQMPALVISGLLGIVMAYYGCGVWSLVAMYLARAALFTIFLWIGTDWKPSFVFDRRKLNTHFNFGYKILLTTIMDKVYQNLYNLVIGRSFSATQLGYYTRAFTLVQVPVQGLADPLYNVTLPALAAIQNDNLRLQVSYRKLMQQTLFVIVPVLTMMIITADPLFRLLLTDKWLPAIPYFRILCVAGMLNTVNGYNLNILLVKGRSDLYLRVSFIEKVFITIGILSTFAFGIYGLLYFQVASTIAMFLVNSSIGGKLIHYSGLSQVKDVYHIFLIALPAAAAAALLDHYWGDPFPGKWGYFIRISAVCSCFIACFIGVCMARKIQEIQDFRDLVKRLI